LQGAERVSDVVGRAGAAYVLVEGQPCLQVVDLADPSAPRYVRSQVDAFQDGFDGALSLDPIHPLLAVLVATDRFSTYAPFFVLDIRKPLDPIPASEGGTRAQSGGLELRAPLLVGTCSTRRDTPAHSLHSFRTGSDTRVSSIGIDAEHSRVAALDGERALVYSRATGESGRERLRIFDVGEPEGAPLAAATLDLGSRALAMAILGDTLAVVGHGVCNDYTGASAGDSDDWRDTYTLSTIDLRDPATPTLLDSWTFDSPWSFYCAARKALAVREDGIALVSDGYDLHLLDVANPWAIRKLATLPGERGDVGAIDGSIAVVTWVQQEESFRRDQHLTVLDLADPHEPRVVARWMGMVADGSQGWSDGHATDLEMRDGHAWLLGHAWRPDWGGWQIGEGKLFTVDITDPATPELVETISLDRAHDFAFDDSLLYIAEGSTSYNGPGCIRIRRVVGPGRSSAVSELWYRKDIPGPYPGPEARLLPFGLRQLLTIRGRPQSLADPGPPHQIDAFLPAVPADLAVGTPVTSAETVPFGDLALIRGNIVVSVAGTNLETMPLRYGSPGVPRLIAERVLPPLPATPQ